MVFFFNDTTTTEIYTYGHTLSLHDALPISPIFGQVAQRGHEVAVRRLVVDQDREGFRLVAPVLQPVEAVVGDQVGRIALDDAEPLLRDDVGVLIFALVVEHLPVVEAEPGARKRDVWGKSVSVRLDLGGR